MSRDTIIVAWLWFGMVVGGLAAMVSRFAFLGVLIAGAIVMAGQVLLDAEDDTEEELW